jgi:hypothetical protein
MIFEPIAEDDVIITDSRSHCFPVAIAMKYSVHMAVWISHLAHWTEKHLAYNENIHDGLCWNYTTIAALGDLIPYMTPNQRRTVIDNSIKEGLVIKGNYNKTKYDRTVWYALTPKAYLYYAHLLTEKNIKHLWLSICEKTQMDLLAFTNLFVKNHQPIPNTKPDTKTNINISTSDEVPDIENNSEENEDLGNSHNQALEEHKAQKGLDVSDTCTKSDYRNNQDKYLSDSSKLKQYDIKDILSSNIFQIPEQIIHDWITNRKKKRAPVTQTAWNKINKELAKCKELGIDPLEAFETMVASGWQSLKVEYFITKELLSKQETAKKRSMELEQMAERRKQKEIEDSKRLNGIVSQASEVARNKLRQIVGLRSPLMNSRKDTGCN